MPAFLLRGRRYENPAELALDVLGGKWKMPILWRLKERDWRYGELRRDLGRVTDKMLTQQLRELERDGLLVRTVHQVVPPHVDYSITPLGRTAVPAIDGLRSWGTALRKSLGGGTVLPKTPAPGRSRP
jgi:DNA-binding HxlR family transcriptional regulator